MKKQRNIGEEILKGVKEIKAWQRGEVKLKTTRLNMPEAKDVPKIRDRLGLSQQGFAAIMGVSVATLRNWEQGRREPHGPARSLLLVAEKAPNTLQKIVKQTVVRVTQTGLGHGRKAAAKSKTKVTNQPLGQKC